MRHFRGTTRIRLGAARWRVAGVALMLAACLSGPARAQPEPVPEGDLSFARKGSGAPITDGHGWMVTRELPVSSASRGMGRVVLHHLPPRLGDASDLGGVVRRVISLDAGESAGAGGSEGGIWGVSGGGVDGIAWTMNRVYLLMPEELTVGAGGGEHWARRVLMVSALHAAGTTYEYLPQGRVAARASLPSPAGGSAVVGFAAMPGTPPRDGLCAMVVPRAQGGMGGDGVSEAVLWLLVGESWVRANGPWGQSGDGGDGQLPRPKWRCRDEEGGRWKIEPLEGRTAQLLDWRDGVAVAMVEQGNKELWVWVGTTASGVKETAGLGGPTLKWTRQVYSLRDASLPNGRVPTPLRLALVQGKVAANDVLVGFVPGTVSKPAGSLVALRPNGPMQTASLGGIPEGADVLPMAAPAEGVNPAGRLAMVWNVRSAERADRTQICEYSAASGLLLYDGAVRADEFAERQRMQMWGVVGVMGMVGAIAVGFRGRIERRAFGAKSGVLPSGSGAATLDQMRAADPLRRLAAAMLDYAPSAVTVALMQGRDAIALLMPSTMFGGAAGMSAELDLGPFAMVLAVTVLHTTVLEWLFGRSVGKFVLGVRVVDARAAAEGRAMVRPGLWQTAVRNVVRWAAPLLAVFALLDESGRHPGDLAGQTLVVADPNDGS